MKILLVSTTAIGDSVMATPFIRAVRQKFPAAEITLFAHVRRMAVFENNPHLNRILIYYGKWKKLIRTLCDLRKVNFDMVIVLHANDPDIVPLIRWTGAPIRIGWGESKWAYLFTHSILRTQPREHFLIHKKRLLETAGIPVSDLSTEMFLTPSDSRAFEQRLDPWLSFISPQKKFVVMHAFGTHPGKWWPLEHFFKVANQTFAEFKLPTVFLGDSHALQQVQSHSLFDSKHHAVAKNFNLRESAVVIQKSSAMLTTDSGPMHMAFAVKCPTLSLFGVTSPEQYGACFDQNLHSHLHCNPLSELTIEDVWKSWSQKIRRV